MSYQIQAMIKEKRRDQKRKQNILIFEEKVKKKQYLGRDSSSVG